MSAADASNAGANAASAATSEQIAHDAPSASASRAPLVPMPQLGAAAASDARALHLLYLPFSAAATSASAINYLSPLAGYLSHVRVDATPLEKMEKSLTGRLQQRYEGGRRVVCGAVAVRIDRNPPRSEQEVNELLKTIATKDASALSAVSAKLVADNQSLCVPSEAASSDYLLSVLLVRSSKRDEWIFPKGGWESFETASACAARECLEESGVGGTVIASMQSREFDSRKGNNCKLLPFLMLATVQYTYYHEQKKRRRMWVPLHQVDQYLIRGENQELWQETLQVLKQKGMIHPSNGQAQLPAELSPWKES